MDWSQLLDFLESLIGKKPQDIKSVLYLVGVQELGKGFRSFSKEEKQDLIHIGTCSLLSRRGYYQFQGRDEEGWPHFDLLKPIPNLEKLGQEELMKELAIEYFQIIKDENNHL